MLFIINKIKKVLDMDCVQDIAMENDYKAPSSSTSYPRTDNRENNVETSQDSSEGNTNLMRKQALIRCFKCGSPEKPKLRPCNVCKVYQCKNCIKLDFVDKSNKRRRNPALFVCKTCLIEEKREGRVKHTRSRDISINLKRRDSLLTEESNQSWSISTPKNIMKPEKVQAQCIFCKSQSKKVEVLRTYYDLYYCMNQLLNKTKDEDLPLRQAFKLLYQTGQADYSFSRGIPLKVDIASCEECLKFCLKGLLLDNKGFDSNEVLAMSDDSLLASNKKGLDDKGGSDWGLADLAYQLLIANKLNDLFDNYSRLLCNGFTTNYFNWGVNELSKNSRNMDKSKGRR